jgi:sigma-B regulation protein RsbU (phosphoserine phosphatase)
VSRNRISRRVRVLLYSLLLLAAHFTFAQATKAQAAPPKAGTFDATTLREPTDLAAIWLIHAGDDPAYARPDFDDSGWTPFDSSSSLRQKFPHDNPSIVWYRLHIKVSPTHTGLALEESNISREFSVYANGVKLIDTAHDTGAPISASIPENQIASGSVVIALRVKLAGADWGGREPGFYSTNLRLGQQTALLRDATALHDHRWLTTAGRFALSLLLDIFELCLSVAAILLYSAQPRQREYLWLFLTGICLVPPDLLGMYSAVHSQPAGWHLIDALVGLGEVFWALTYLAFVQQRIGWALKILLLITGVSLGTLALVSSFGAVTTASRLTMLVLPADFLFIVVLPALLLIHWRRGNRDAGILLLPLLLSGVVQADWFAGYVLWQMPRLRSLAGRLFALLSFSVGPFTLNLGILANILSAIALSLIILLRTNRLSREGAELEGEMAAARQVQQVMLPEQIEAIPGFTIESVYLPAKQVGGDFFQILSVPNEGGMLVVVGDVAGKGLPAAMLVSVLVGAIRSTAAYGHAPDEMLAQLNERLVGRASGGFSTALAAYIDPTGQVTIANAGHLSPYLDGAEVELPGALPLGIVSGATYDTTSFQIERGSRLTFYSDGVVEAQDAKGKLLGFERGQQLSTQPPAAIVEAARSFGQSDDITVVAIAREPATAQTTLEPVMA